MRKARRRRIMRSPIAPAATGSKEKAAPEGTAPSVQSRESGSALGELEAAAGLGLAVLLAFHHAAVASEETEIGRAHVLTPVTNAQLVCRLLLDKKNPTNHYTHN